MANVRAGVYDPGAVSHGLAEADIALQWVLTTNWILKNAGFETFLTRDDDRDVTPVGSRDNMALAAGCTHFVSLHCNAGGGTGVETYYRGADDLPLARLVNNCGVIASSGRDRGLKSETETRHKRLAVLDFKGPACLVELGFIDRSADRKWLVSRDARIRFANALATGLLKVDR
jgi:N-acetylmuramoyl-L-alanine amidase